MNQVLLFNPRSANNKYRIPNSVLQVAASIEGLFDWFIVDGNRETAPWQKIESYLKSGAVKYVGFTVMPGPQLKQAIPYAKKIRQQFPQVVQIWGGYFASNQYKAVLDSGYVDYVINGPGDVAFPALLKALENNAEINTIGNLIYKEKEQFVKTKKLDLPDLNTTPALPYDKLDNFYSLEKYLGKTYLGSRTLAYHSSFGCPFTCSFCAVVPIYEARWKGKSAQLIYEDVQMIRDKWGADAIEFHDNNFFVSEKRTVEFAKLIRNDSITWWGEARIDTMHKYKDESLQLISDAGCRMIFFGAETGSDEVLKKMDKGGTQTGKQILEFAARLRKFNIIPEYSFVLGTPAETPEKVMRQIDEDIEFIRQVKKVNPDAEIVIYVYSPVPTEGSEMYEQVLKSGFRFPVHLEDWLNDEWEKFDLRKNPLTPWLNAKMVNKIKNFETVLNGYYPTVSDVRMNSFQRKVIRALSSLRYKQNIYAFPYELKALQKFWIRYRQPEIQGF